jgi:hypothetical protein
MRFQKRSFTNGNARYLSHRAAIKQRVIEAHESFAILRLGKRNSAFARDSVHVSTKQRWTHFLSVLRFNQVPFGPGVWPAFWSNGVGRWPNSGELNILEYANNEPAKIVLHTGKNNHCKLDSEEVNRCVTLPDANNMSLDCYTEYRPNDPFLGCAPTHPKAHRTGREWASSPGVIAAEWAEGFVKVFYIPEQELPGDLLVDQPQPNTWDRWLVAFFPFSASEKRQPGSCPRDPLSASKFILNIELCGDWAGHTFEPDRHAPHFAAWKEKIVNGQCQRKHWSAPDDCCTQYTADPLMDAFFEKTAIFNITSLKVYQQQS